MGPAAFSCMAPAQPPRRQLEPISFTEIRLEVRARVRVRVRVTGRGSARARVRAS